MPSVVEGPATHQLDDRKTIMKPGHTDIS